MNLLYYCEEYPPVRNGGIGTVVKLVAEAMAKRGHRVIVAGRYWEGQGRRTIEEINGVTVVRWHKENYQTLGIRACNLIRDGERMRKVKMQRMFDRTCQLIGDVIKEYRIDLLELPDYVDDFVHYDTIDASGKSFSVPTVMRVHGSASFLFHCVKGVEDEKRVIQDKAYFQCADAVCAVSGFSKRYVEDWICKDKSVDVIYNPIEDALFENVTESGDADTILFFGKVVETKGAFNLIKAFNAVAERHPQARLKLVGNGDIEATRGLVDAHCADRISFVGFMPKEQVMNEIDHASFCVLPSYFENFSMAALEVLARKRALVYTHRASGPELIEDGVNGLLVDPENVEQIVEKMDLLLSDADLRNRLASNGYEMCRNRFSTKVIIPQMEQYYRDLIARCRK